MSTSINTPGAAKDFTVGTDAMPVAGVASNFVFSKLVFILIFVVLNRQLRVESIAETAGRFGEIISFLGLLTYIYWPRKLPVKAMWQRAEAMPMWRSLALAAGLTLALKVGFHVLDALSGEGAHLPAPAVTTLTIWNDVLMGPMIEEIIYRAVILNVLLSRFSVGPAIVANALIFSLVHGLSASAFIGGLFLCLIYLQTGRLSAAFLAHVIGNLYGITIAPQFNNLAQVLESWPTWMSRLTTGAVMVILIGAFAWALACTWRRKAQSAFATV